MKKNIVLLMAVMMFSFVACGTNENDPGDAKVLDSAKVLDTDWTKGEIQFDGEILKFPFKFSELEALGWQITTVPDSVDSWEWSTLALENSKYNSDKILVFATIDVTEEGNISDYEVSGLEIVMWAVEENDEKPLVSINGVTYGDSREKVEERLGKTEENNQSDKQYIHTYTYFSQEPETVLATAYVGMKEDGIVKAFGMHYNLTE